MISENLEGLSWISAGFPSPAESFAEPALNLHELAVPNPAATFFLRVAGHSMRGAGVLAGDVVVVDRSLTAQANDLVVAQLGGDFTLKRLCFEEGRPFLAAENPDFPPLRPRGDQELQIFGVVRAVFRTLR